jgi:hypothetical protein
MIEADIRDRDCPLYFRGVLGIIVTQSNDIGFGIPVSLAFYSSTHPKYFSYNNLLTPISLVHHVVFSGGSFLASGVRS